MQAQFEKISTSVNHSFYVNHLVTDFFKSPLHFHPEVEILLVVEGTGTRFVGDSVESFSPGDLLLIGSNVPHVWFNDREFYQQGNEKKANAIYIQFKEDFFGEAFALLPEMQMIRDLLARSQRGIKFSKGVDHDKISEMINKIPKADGFERVHLLLGILLVKIRQVVEATIISDLRNSLVILH